MNQFPINSLYSQNSGSSSTTPFVEFFSDRDPNENDINFPIQKRWYNFNSSIEFILVSFDTTSGSVQANWQPIGSSSTPIESISVPNGTSPVFPTSTGNISFTSASNSIQITGSTNSINFDVTPTPTNFTWQEITESQSFVVNNGYITNSPSVITLTLPLSASLGDIVAIVGEGLGGWIIDQNTSQVINIGSSKTTVTSGTVSSSNSNDCIELICISDVGANLWTARSWVGNLTIS